MKLHLNTALHKHQTIDFFYSCKYAFTKLSWAAKKGLAFIFLMTISLIGSSQITSDQFNRGFEDGAAGIHWVLDGTGALITPTFVTSPAARTGAYSAQTVSNNTTFNIWRNATNVLTVPACSTAHLIGWANFNSNRTEVQPSIRFGLGDINGSPISGTPTGSWRQFTQSRTNTCVGAVTAVPAVRTRSNTGGTTITSRTDDVVFYWSNSTLPDLAKPNAPSCFAIAGVTANSIVVRWTNSADNAAAGTTGVQGTLILRATSGSVPTLLDQGTYTTSTSAVDGQNVIGTWTIIADVPSTQTNFTDNTVLAGTSYRYTAVHYDLALNYSSSATLVSATAATPTNIPNISQSIQNITRPTGGRFEPGDIVQINVVVDNTGGTIYNLKTRINLPTGMVYQTGAMQITDNKGFAYNSSTVPANSCRTYTQPGSATISGAPGPLTEAGADDRGRFDASGGFAEIILGDIPNETFANLESGVNNMHGGRLRSSSSPNDPVPSYYDYRSIIIGSIRAQIPVGATPGTVYDISSTTNYSYYENSGFSPLIPYIINSTTNTDKFIQIVVSDPTLPTTYAGFGANLFTLYNNGTFGEGTADDGPHTLSGTTLIRVAPGLDNTGDGKYSIAKNTAKNLAQTSDAIAANHADRTFTHWYVLGDHTNAADANLGNPASATGTNGGYALVVNADYVPTRVVNQTLNGLCAGTYYNFRAWFRNVCPSCGVNSNTGDNTRNSPVYNVLNSTPGGLPNLTFDVNNQAFYSTGPINVSDNWIQKQFVFSPDAGGNFNFSIRNNAPGGDGNDWMMDDVRIITRGPIASVNVDADPVIDPDPTAYCIGQRFQIIGNWIENTGSFTQYDSYQFQYSYAPNGPWSAIDAVSELPAPNDPNNPTGWIDTAITQQFVDANQDVYFRVVVATQPSNISLADAAPCQITAYNSSVVKIGTCVLPIKLLRFKAATFGQQVFLNWAAAEINRLQYYVIERSSDGVNFSRVKQVDAKEFASPYQYQLVDQPNTSSDRLWYRLKMVHMNNEITYSNIETVGWRKSSLSLSIQPNPAKDVIQLNWSGVKPNQKIQLSINTISGRTVHSETITVQQGPTQSLRLPALPAGLYMLQVEDPTNQYRQTIKLNKL